MTSRIKEIVNLYKFTFPMGWVDGFDWSQDRSAESLESVRDKVKMFEQETFFLFAQSVLSGEYLIKKDFPSTLDALYDLITSGEIFYDETEPLKTAAAHSFNAMTYELGRVIRDFRHLLTVLNNKYEYRQTKYIVNAYRVKRDIETEGSYGPFYDILLAITRIDHLLSYDKGILSDLIIFHTELSKAIELKNQPDNVILVFSILNEKCLFLLKKLLIEDNKVFDFMVDFEHKQYDTGKIPFKFFSEMDKRFEFYRAESYANDPYGDELDLKARNKNLQIGQFTLLMKYYKDSKNTRKPQIDNILKDFNQTYEALSAQFTKRPLDRYALGTLKNYMYNCRYSFLMQDTSYSFEELQNGLDEIMDIQSQTGILNFYPYRKAFEKALQMLRNNDTLDIVELDEYKAFLQLCISKFSEAIQWCRTNCFYPVQNAYRECLVPVANFGAVFIASSFCRPVRYGKLKDELNTFKSQALLMDNEIALRLEKKELKDLKKDIDHSRTREIEVLSVFTAIITFLFGTIGFFADNKNNDFLHLVFSVFGLGAVLLIFVSGIHLLTMRKEENVGDYFKHPRAWFCIVTTLACIGLLIWLIFIVKSLPNL